jgi:cytoskeletal protein RodZ
MTLGTTIRDAREAARVSIESLSESTNLRIGLLTEMESDNFKHCGGDTYARGHLRNIAQRIGLNPQILIDLYNQEQAVESQRIQDSLVDNNIIQVPREKKSLSWKIPALFSVAILAVIAIVQIVVSNQSTSPSPAPIASARASASATPSTTASASAVATTSASPMASPAKSISAGPVSLVVSAPRGNSYINIIVDGKDVEKSSIFQGEKKSYQGLTSISVYFSNPAALDVTYNGKLLAPLGGENQEVRRTFR